MLWINGQLQEQLSVLDRGAQYGDGCFTTARVSAGEIVWFDRHIVRMQQATARLLFPPVDWESLIAEMKQAALGRANGVVKVMLTRGVGGRGYSTQGCAQPSRIVIQADYPVHYVDWREQGIRLNLSPVALAKNPLLAGIKHLNRLEQVLIRAHLDQTSADETLVLDTSGALVECCAANLFWRKGHRVYTPDLSQSGVDGVARQHIIALLAGSDFELQIVSEPIGVLADADEVLVCNALMPLVPVNQAHVWRYHSRELYQFLSSNC
ncbi:MULTISPECIES: aminodeoxychorismate lyase [Pectobacterium]|uniref:Aminodeoxychorismate lyase n=1 Tax=Pectobacterium punjabense TaxID=2108399 RepID=A0ABX6L370_9GAMM|nr:MULTISPECIES: aminodeoxychorismate lyase [Pectobacterium]GKW10502.1 aminodeoxychorismate lyase [Pectobacterium carotovorum subsp. carotovorum]MBS4431649.1 aminodeoxychorismate lyase [Pectobacterium punjabense]MBT9185642.1 aminodeoxychorismate lyase [Pectobacterium punjabense]MCE9730379.1 aminodeoxychorismate lyase [Pectobacterium sp. IFB5596]MDG0795903.1 aminodeoxychorismate lyase [Pectobacterium punjabense]